MAGHKKRKQLTCFFFLINLAYAQQGGKKEEVYEKRNFKAVEKSRATEALSIMGSIAAAMERGRLVSSENKYPASLAELDIEFSNLDGTPATKDEITTNNFTIKLAVGGSGGSGNVVTATRKGGNGTGYTLTRDYYTGKVVCAESDDRAGICASLGLQKAS